METRADFSNLNILEKIPSKFGNGAHVFISKNLIGRKVKIIAGNCKIKGKEIKIDFFNSEILERHVTNFGTGAHIIIPREYSGKKIKLIIGDKNE